MKQTRWVVLALLALTCAVATLPGTRAEAAARKSSAEGTHARKGAALHQFSGIVTALDKGSLTVAKAGKEPKTMVFTKLADTRTTGDVEKDAHVTVWYRDEAGKAIAHRVVVKGAEPAAAR